MTNTISLSNTGNTVTVNRTGYTITIYDGGLPADPITAASYGGLTAWLDCSLAAQMYSDYPPVTLVANDGDAVAYYDDLSSELNNFVQTTPGSRPLYKLNRQNSLSGVLFQGTDDYLYSTACAAFYTANVKTVVMVLKNISGTGGLIGDSGGYFGGQIQGATTARFYNYDGANDTVDITIPVAGTAFVLTFWHTGGYLYLQTNDGTPSAGVASGLTTVQSLVQQVGSAGGGYANFDLYELAIYSQALSATDRAALVDALMTKWGIA
jgi:hypothetical protein